MPLKPFSPPEILGVPLAITPSTFFLWFLNLALVYWFIYSAIAVYHWITYSHNANIATPAIVLHFFVSLILVGYAVSGLLPL